MINITQNKPLLGVFLFSCHRTSFRLLHLILALKEQIKPTFPGCKVNVLLELKITACKKAIDLLLNQKMAFCCSYL